MPHALFVSVGLFSTIDTVTVTYDALGRMVEQNKSGSYTEIVYDPLGSKLALMSNTSTLKQGFAPLPAGATAVYNASGLQYYRHPDWLGSSRFASTPSRTMYNDLAFAPFGEPYAQAGGSDTSFTGQNQDTTTNLYDFMYREYGIQGRWPSPDPAGVAAANPANPQSWNRYAYVVNNPLGLTDPLGLYYVDCIWTGNCLGLQGGAGGGNYGGGPGGCSLDGVQTACGNLTGLGSNGIVPCPDNNCGPFTGSNGLSYRFIGTAEGGAYINPLNGELFTDGSELGLPDLDDFLGYPFPNSTGQGGSGGGGGAGGCTTQILGAVNNHFGQNFTSANVTGEFQYSTGAPPGQGTLNLNISGDGVSPGRYPVNWWTYVIGYGSTLHISAGPGGPDSPQTLVFSSSQFTAHLDSAFVYNPIGAVFHLLIDVKGMGGYKPCP